MKRVIGIADLCEEGVASIGINYVNAVLRAGHVPVVLPRAESRETLAAMLDRVDVLMLAGGCDLDPATFGAEPSPNLGRVVKERDTLELALLDEAVRRRMPVVGICRGIQVINVYCGGTLYQDLPSEWDGPALTEHQRPDKPWEAVHDITIVEGTLLARLLGRTRIGVNSTHHQAIRQLGQGLTVTARADDGVIEAIEARDLPIVGVQFHPERLEEVLGILEQKNRQ